MESNRDEAEKCISIATEALQDGDKEKAVKFLRKAEKLFPTDKAKVILEALSRNGSSTGNGTAHHRKSSENNNANHNERAGQGATGAECAKSYTKEQLEGVQRLALLSVLGVIPYQGIPSFIRSCASQA
ncbi:dnaJ homolog subfamily B member 14-like [Engraulis encrasicolus]|uniref:dnaJ homolog subfamily B member 14-like n=1 Tax=Engraulis encrasicolus TaxID=184585 RepID=UPI002FCF7A7C